MNFKPIRSIDLNMVEPHEPAVLPDPCHQLSIRLTVGFCQFNVIMHVVIVSESMNDDVIDLTENEAVEEVG